MLKNLEEKLRDKLFLDLELNTPPSKEMGDLAISCFVLAKKENKNPAEFAKELAEKINEADVDLIEKAQSMGPYVNIILKTSSLAKEILNDIFEKGEKYGANKIGKGKEVLLEYPSQNTHKEFHVGHLRNVCIGNTLVGLYKKAGYNIKAINYINDFGAHVAKCLWGILNLGRPEPTTNKQEWLGNIYAEASRIIDADEEKKIQAQEIQKKLEDKDPEIFDLFLRTKEWSIEGFNKIQDELGVIHDEVFFESDIKEKGQKIVDELLQKGVAEVGEGGAIIVNLEKYGLDTALIRKSNGAGVYMTSDLGLAGEKKAKYPNIDESINITGIEQNFYFDQLYKILELNGFEYKMTHIGYGLVTLPGGKMSSRKGNVVLYKDVLNQVFEYLKHETKKRHLDWNEEKIDGTAQKLALAAIKFSIQKHEASKNMIFDIEEAAAISGYTGLYILYTVARINSILKNVEDIEKTFDSVPLLEAEEKNVLLKISFFPDVCQKALESYNPSAITRYCFDLASDFNDFYTKHKVMLNDNLEVQQARVALCLAVKIVLENALEILTIEPVLEM